MKPSTCRLPSSLFATCAVGMVAVSPVFAQNPATTVTVNATGNVHAISPNIYGVAFASASDMTALNFVLNRYGGNSSSTYNWQLNADNRGGDWFFESIADTNATAGYRGDNFISTTRGA